MLSLYIIREYFLEYKCVHFNKYLLIFIFMTHTASIVFLFVFANVCPIKHHIKNFICETRMFQISGSDDQCIRGIYFFHISLYFRYISLTKSFPIKPWKRFLKIPPVHWNKNILFYHKVLSVTLFYLISINNYITNFKLYIIRMDYKTIDKFYDLDNYVFNLSLGALCMYKKLARSMSIKKKKLYWHSNIKMLVKSSSLIIHFIYVGFS